MHLPLRLIIYGLSLRGKIGNGRHRLERLQKENVCIFWRSFDWIRPDASDFTVFILSTCFRLYCFILSTFCMHPFITEFAPFPREPIHGSKQTRRDRVCTACVHAAHHALVVPRLRENHKNWSPRHSTGPARRGFQARNFFACSSLL